MRKEDEATLGGKELREGKKDRRKIERDRRKKVQGERGRREQSKRGGDEVTH